MLLRHRKALTAWQRDWQTAEQRMAGARITEDSPCVKVCKGVMVILFSVVAVWLLWAMTSDASRAFFYRMAGG